MPNPTNPFGPVVSATVSAFTIVALVLAIGVLAAGLRDAILNDWADDVPEPLDDLDAPDDEPRRDLLDEAGLHRRIILEGDAATRWLEAHSYMSPEGLVWPPPDPEPWRQDAWAEGGPIVGWTRRLDGVRFRHDDDGEVRP